MILRILHTLILLLLFTGWSYGQPESGKKIENYFGTELTISNFDTYLESKMDSLNIPGLSFALINDGEVVHHKVLGYADVETKKPVTDQTIFEGASLSKSVFAFFVMSYVDDGKLDLDKPLWEYLPYPDIADDERYKKITARMVLSHRSGLPNWRSDEMDSRLKIYFEPGTDYKYSGEGYQYLAKVLMEIENTDREELEKNFQQKTAQPLGLEHTGFLQTSFTKKHKAVPYDENGRRMIPPMNDGEFGAAYSIHSESIDFARWMIALMNRELLKDESYNELFKRHSSVPNDEPDIYYTLGFMTPDFPDLGPNIYLHYGNNDGFTSMYILDTEKEWGFIVFTNSEYSQILGNELAEHLIPEPE